MPAAFAMLVSPNSDADSATHFFMPMNRFNELVKKKRITKEAQCPSERE